ncbi:MAG TPA: hypothetical protein VI455_14890 [Terriglobia bacterium]
MEEQISEGVESPHRGAKTPGEEPACLQIAVGILGSLLLLASTLLSRWRWSHGTGLGVLVLFAGVILAAAGGSYGLGRKRRRGSTLMSAGGILLTLAAIVLLLTAGDDLNWHFPLGVIFLAIAIFSDLATYRFRRALIGEHQ